MYRTILAATIIGAFALLMPLAEAQQPQPGTAVPQTNTPVAANQGEHTKSKLIAQWLAADNHVESEIAKMAEENAKSDEVKKFAKTICDEHKKAKERLTKAVPGSSLDINNDQSSNSQDAQASNPQQTQPGQLANQNTSRNDISQLKKKIAQKRVEMLKKELKNKDGKDFDTAFLGYQLVQHQNMIASLSVLEDETDGELQSAVKEERKAAETSYEKAKKLMKDLKG